MAVTIRDTLLENYRAHDLSERPCAVCNKLCTRAATEMVWYYTSPLDVLPPSAIRRSLGPRQDIVRVCFPVCEICAPSCSACALPRRTRKVRNFAKRQAKKTGKEIKGAGACNCKRR